MNSRDFANVPVMRKPSPESGYILKNLQKKIESKYHVKFENYWEFQQWSTDHLPEFWGEMWDFTGIIYSRMYTEVVDLSIPVSSRPQWFIGAKLNYAENLLKFRDHRTAMVIAGEERDPSTVSFAQMYEEASLYAAAFRKAGLKKGDVVACYLPNRAEAIFAMQAAVSIGAIWTGVLPLLGAQAVLNRLQQVKPKMLLTIDRFKNDRQEIDMMEKIEKIVKSLETLDLVLIFPSSPDSKLKNIKTIKNSCFLDDFLTSGRNSDGSIPPLEFEQVSTNHPVFIHYTSGTTGIPKALVHGAAALLAVARDFSIHSCADRNSLWFSVSPAGWVSWTAVASLHFMGGGVFLFEGVPYFLSPTYFWNMVREHRMTHLFLPASVVDELQKRNYVPTADNQLETVEVFMCGGSVVKPQCYDFMYEKVKKDVAFASSYGTTELMCSNIILDASLPIYKGEIPCISLGATVQVVNESGEPVFGELGEVVIAKPMPNLPLGLWEDPNGEKFRDKYFSKYSEKFSLSDFAIINPVTKGMKMCCRSDETLKQRGYRFGSSEIYNVVDELAEVRDSLCVSHYSPAFDERAVLFIKMREGYRWDERFFGRIRQAIASELTAGHVPDIIMQAPDIPYNVNGKKMEVIVKKILNQLPFTSDSLRNPESLEFFHNLPQLQDTN